MISYISTRGGGAKNFEDILLDGLAPDGGLYVPQSWPKIDVKALEGKSYQDIAEAVMYPFVEGSIPRSDFRAIVDATYNDKIFRAADIAPLKKLSDELYILELFHGPTIAFKDVALQLLGRLFDYVLKKRDEKVTIAGATSGDTGSAAIEGCRHSDRVNIFILHPKGRVSDVQRLQMTTVKAPNVHNIALEGTFDDCQNLVKAMFNDAKFRGEMNLSAVNSINWARIMAQIVYYFHASLKMPGSSFVVPTGNFGNVYAAYCARKMGAPIKNLIIASNANDILTRFFETGEMEVKKAVATMSPSMDIQVSSNFERYMFDLLDRDAKKLSTLMEEFKTTGDFVISANMMKKARAEFTAFRADEKETLDVMKEVHAKYKYVLDPHSAVGVHAALEMVGDEPIISLATAHPAKFPDAVTKATGQHPPLPLHLAGLMDKPEYVNGLPNDLGAVETFIKSASK